MSDSEETKDEMTEEVDDQTAIARKSENYIAKIGSLGRYQILYIIACQLFNFFFATGAFSANFNLLKPSITCVSPNSSEVLESCDALKTCGDNVTVEPLHGFHSLGYEWRYLNDMACESAAFDPVLLLASCMQIAEGLGSITAGLLSDLFGRRIFLLIGTVAATSSYFASAWANSFVLYGVLYIFSVFVCQIAAIPAITLGNEYSLGHDRLTMSFGHNWGVAYLVVALGAYLTMDWRHYTLFGSSFGAVSFIFFIFYDESPRWLLANRKYEKATQSLNAIARKNGRSNIVFDSQKVRNEFESVKGHMRHKPLSWRQTVVHVFQHRGLALTILAFYMYRFLFLLMFSTITFNFSKLFTTPYTSMAIMGAIRVWAPVVLVLMDRYGDWFYRKRFLSLSFFLVIAPMTLGTALLIVAEYTEEGVVKDRLQLAMTLCMLAANSLNAGVLYYAALQISMEVFPTNVRNQLIGWSAVAGSIGGAVGAQLIQTQKVWAPMPYVIVDVATILCYIFCMWAMPETKQLPLPDSFADLHVIFGK